MPTIPPNPETCLDLLSFVTSEIPQEKGSTFQAFAGTVYGPEQVDNMYLKLRKDFPTAKHISLGYRFNDENDKPLQGAVSDGEHQADVKLLDVMHKSQLENIAIFVVRKYGGVHIGGARLNHIQKAATQALSRLGLERGDVMEATDDEQVAESSGEGEEFTQASQTKAKKKARKQRGHRQTQHPSQGCAHY